jgi:hypothetical protein
MREETSEKYTERRKKITLCSIDFGDNLFCTFDSDREDSTGKNCEQKTVCMEQRFTLVLA